MYQQTATTAFSPQRKIYGQQYGGMAGRGMSPTSAPASSAFAGARGATPMGSVFNRIPQGGSQFAAAGRSAQPQTAGRVQAGRTASPTDRWDKWKTLTPAQPAANPAARTNPYQPGTPEYGLWDQYNSVNGKNVSAASQEAFRQMIGAGMYNPGGSQSMIDALRGQAVGDADALRQRSNTMGQLSGMDPAQAASSYFQRDMGSQGEVQRMLLNARLQSMTANQARLQGLAGSGQDAAWQAWLRNYAQAQPPVPK